MASCMEQQTASACLHVTHKSAVQMREILCNKVSVCCHQGSQRNIDVISPTLTPLGVCRPLSLLFPDGMEWLLTPGVPDRGLLMLKILHRELLDFRELLERQ
mmetsp:Transcript_10197/g.19706  ORF Transcript_10197/g.19706 Transcript_10197/m.19706 type:complete len:102 (-) Transcript_10197:164-469(-)